MFELIFLTTKLQGKRLTLPAGKEIVIGREPGCQLMLPSTLISRRHCELKQAPEGIWVRDLGSQNGTYVNDVAIASPTLLRPGDVLRVGAASFEVQVSRAAAKAKVSKETPTDDAIASWLTDHEGPASQSDTTVIHGDQTQTPVPPTAPATPAGVPARKFKTVKDEAADIIRRHWAAVKEQQESGGPSS
jgi:pSer/pThr/pTyr-binding forkhead associated (FHA) protein